MNGTATNAAATPLSGLLVPERLTVGFVDAANWLVREAAPGFLTAAGYGSTADYLHGLPELSRTEVRYALPWTMGLERLTPIRDELEDARHSLWARAAVQGVAPLLSGIHDELPFMQAQFPLLLKVGNTARRVTARSRVGALAYECAWHAATTTSMAAHLRDEPAPPLGLVAGYQEAVTALLERCDHTDRPDGCAR